MANIEIINRYRDKLVFEDVEPNKFRLQMPDHCRVGYDDEKMENIAFIDPSGGPFVGIGNKLDDNHEVVKIIEDVENRCFWLETKTV